MNRERANADRRVVETLEQLAPSKLFDGEKDVIRWAADNLIFCKDLVKDEAARNALGSASVCVGRSRMRDAGRSTPRAAS